MSLITQCPACSTMFRVVPDQLRLSEGWVRCGQCEEVFDANAHLRTLDAPVHGPAPAQDDAAPMPAPSLALAVPDQVEEPPPEPPLDAAHGSQLANPWDQPGSADWNEQWNESWKEPWKEPWEEPRSEPVSHGTAAEEDPLGQPLADSGEGLLQPVGEVPTDDLEPVPLQTSEPEPALGPEPEPAVALAQTPEEVPVPSFLSKPASPAPTARWLGTKALLAICTVLAAALASQGLWQQRNYLAATEPALRPLLLAGCEQLGCSLSPLQQIEAIAIDSSAFTSVAPGVYLLKVSLKNTGAMELATPALELTLTDSQDQPLLRRVLLPTELADKPAIGATAELGISVPVSVDPGATPKNIAGYRLLAFYP